jgi:trk system potassium uptake protein TrkA
VKTVIVGCGRVGAELASTFDKAGHEVIILDLTPRAFDRLPSTFKGTALRGDGTDEDILRRAGAEDADIFIAMTEGDNRNVLAAQLAQEALGAKRVIAKINDPVRAEAYADLGIAALCRTNLMTDAVNTFLGLPASGRVGILPPTGSHPGGEHHDLAASTGPLVIADRPALRESSVAGQGSSGQLSATSPSGQSAGPAREV